MNEIQLKYGCNPNQKPSRIFMEDGSELPVTVLNGKPGYINFLDAFNGWQLVKELKEAVNLPAAASLQFIVNIQFIPSLFKCNSEHLLSRSGASPYGNSGENLLGG